MVPGSRFLSVSPVPLLTQNLSSLYTSTPPLSRATPLAPFPTANDRTIEGFIFLWLTNLKFSDVKFKFILEINAHDLSESRKFLYRNKTVNFLNTNTKVNFQTSGSRISCEAVMTGVIRVGARALRVEMFFFYSGWSGRLLMLDYNM